jgi:hypothetical protein
MMENPETGGREFLERNAVPTLGDLEGAAPKAYSVIALAMLSYQAA